MFILTEDDKELLQSNKKIAGVYCITSPTNRKYIGQSWNLKKRMNDYLILKCESQIGIYNSLKRHGIHNHRFKIMVVYELENQQNLDWLELLCWYKFKCKGYQLLNRQIPFGKKGRNIDRHEYLTNIENELEEPIYENEYLNDYNERTVVMPHGYHLFQMQTENDT